MSHGEPRTTPPSTTVTRLREKASTDRRGLDDLLDTVPVFGRWTPLAGDDATHAVDLMTDALLLGRVAEVRRPTSRELAATLVLELPIERWSLKVSTDWPGDPAGDVAGDAWAGVVPRTAGWGTPLPAPDLRDGIEVPPSVRQLF